MTTLPKKYINAHTNFFQSFMRIVSLSGGTVILSLGTFYVWFKWFGPGNDPGVMFPGESQGVFIQSPTIVTAENETRVEWIIPTPCYINEIEFKQQGEAIENNNDWGGGTADCAEENGQFICQATLTGRGLVDDVVYRLQTNSDQCSNGEEYVSEVITFSL